MGEEKSGLRPVQKANTHGVVMSGKVDSWGSLRPKGRFLILTVGINSYCDPTMECWHAEEGADALEALLCEDYGFERIETYSKQNNEPLKLRGPNADFRSVDKALERLLIQGKGVDVKEEDSLIIYLTGEGGFLDERKHQHLSDDRRAYFACHDQDGDSGILTYERLKEHLKAIPAGHILLISDHCYSGAATASMRNRDILPREAQSKRSRIILCSGLNEKTDDKGDREDGYSTFTERLFDALNNNTNRVFRTDDLFREYHDQVHKNTGQHPAFRNLSDAGGEQEGEFVFFLKDEFVEDPFDELPFGFARIDPPRGKKLTLADYLRRDVQEYYGWKEHSKLVPCPAIGPGDFGSEDDLLKRVISNPMPLVLAGEGGVGKTRLALELCRLAKAEGWDALFLQSQATESSLQEVLHELTASGRRLILVVDYLERTDRTLHFDHFLQIAEKYTEQLRIIATCRGSFLVSQGYSRPKRLTADDCLILNIPSKEKSEYAEWLQGWLNSAAKSIFSKTDQEKNIVPAIAVIQQYANSLPHDKIVDQNHGWMARLLLRSIHAYQPNLTISHSELAKLLMSFPILSETATGFLSNREFGSALVALEVDGWVSPSTKEQKQWALAHDLLCDYVVSDVFTESKNLAGERLADLLDFGIEWNTQNSVSSSLGRVAHVVFSKIEQHDFFPFLLTVIPYFSSRSVVPEKAERALEMCAFSPIDARIEKLHVLFLIPSLSNGGLGTVLKNLEGQQKKFLKLALGNDFQGAMLILKMCSFNQEMAEQILEYYAKVGCPLSDVERYIEHLFESTVVLEKLKHYVAIGMGSDVENGIAQIEDFILQIPESVTGELAYYRANATSDLGLLLLAKGDPAAAFVRFKEIVNGGYDLSEERYLELYAIANNNKSAACIEMKQYHHAIVFAEDSISRLTDMETDRLRFQRIIALRHRANALLFLQMYEDATVAFALVIRECEDDEDEEFKEKCASSLLNAGFAFSRLNENENALLCYCLIVDRFSSERGSEFWRIVGKSFMSVTDLLCKQEKYEEALGTCDLAIKRFRRGVDSDMVHDFVLCTTRRSMILFQLGRIDDAIGNYRLVRPGEVNCQDNDVLQSCYKAYVYEVELLLHSGQVELANKACNDILTRVGPSNDLYPLTTFLLWLTMPSIVEIDNIVSAIQGLPEKRPTKWNFDEVALHIAHLEETKAANARLVCSYFEGNLSFDDLISKKTRET